MRAYELQAEEGFDALRMVDRPEPPAPGDHDVVVRIHAVSLNYRDLAVLRASKKRVKRIVPVSDGAGEVVAVGERVTRVKVGDRVAAAFFPTWTSGGLAQDHHANALGGSLDGVLAEHVVLAESAWVKIPARFSFEQASTLPCAGVTAWHALFEAAPLRPGDTILVQGTGGVSVFALQLARAAGARVIATSSSADKRARLEQMGAATTIDYRQEPKWGDAVRAAAGGRGVDIVVEVGGAGTFDESVKALRFGGTMALLGILAGTAGHDQYLRHPPEKRPGLWRLCRIGGDVRSPGPGARSVDDRAGHRSRVSICRGPRGLRAPGERGALRQGRHPRDQLITVV